MANWTTDYGSFYNHVNALNVGQYVVEACNGGDNDWQWQMQETGAFDRIEADFYAAINEALPDEVQLAGDEFIGPAYAEDCTWDGELDITAIVESIDFWAIVEKHDVDHALYAITAETAEEAAQTAAEIRQSVSDADAVAVDGAVVRFDSTVYGELLNAYDEDADEQITPYIYEPQLTVGHAGRTFYNITICDRSSTVPSPEDITASVARPDNEVGSDWNWAEAATAVWLDAAREAGITIEAENREPEHPDTEAARVKVQGSWYVLEVGRGGDPDGVRAVFAD